ncbi:hypothetical protein, partial [Burkholderia pseudomultivorans]|uniref:hypothetical protein n=1 Tax=Burkholderia pseudomultivorans TaxID=1207504 RepID=UPI00286FB597
MANPMGAKANYTRSAVNFHNTNNGLAVSGRSGAESFESSFGSFSIAFRFTPAGSRSRNGPRRSPMPVAAGQRRTRRRPLRKAAGTTAANPRYVGVGRWRAPFRAAAGRRNVTHPPRVTQRLPRGR